MPRTARQQKTNPPRTLAGPGARRMRPTPGVEGIALVSLEATTRADRVRIAKMLETQGFGHIRPARLILSRKDATRVASGSKVEVQATVVSEDAETGSTEQTPPAALARALEEAKARGDALKQDLLADPDMLSTAEMATRLGMSQEGVRLKRKRHEVLGLELAKRGIRYPAWQIFEHLQLLPALPHLFRILGDSPWTIYRFLLQHHSELGGMRALDALQRGRTDGVIAAAENVASGAFS